MPRARTRLDVTDPTAVAVLASKLGVDPTALTLALHETVAHHGARSPGAERVARCRAKRRAGVTESVTSVTETVSIPVTESVSNVTETVSNVTKSVSIPRVRARAVVVVSSCSGSKDLELQKPITTAPSGGVTEAPSKPRVMGKAVASPRKYPDLPPNFLAAFAEAWTAAFPGAVFMGGKEARYLAQLCRLHSHAETLRRWSNMLTAKGCMWSSAALLARAWPDFATAQTAQRTNAERRATVVADTMRIALTAVDPRLALQQARQAAGSFAQIGGGAA